MTNKEVLEYLNITFGLDLSNLGKNISDRYNLQEDLRFIKKIVKKLNISLEPKLIEALLETEIKSINDIFYIKNVYGMIEYKSKSVNVALSQEKLSSILNSVNEDRVNSVTTELMCNYAELNRLICKEIMQEDIMTCTEKKRYKNNRYVFVMKDGRRILWNYDYVLNEYTKDGYKNNSKWIGKTSSYNIDELKDVMDLSDCLLILTI